MNSNQDANKIKETFLKYLKKANKENKGRKFCTEILKLYSNPDNSHFSVDTICYLALGYVGVKDLNF